MKYLIMKIKGDIIFTYDDLKSSKLIYNSLEVDNQNYLNSKLNKNKIKYEIESKTLGSFLSTLDDLVVSEIVGEKIIITTDKK